MSAETVIPNVNRRELPPFMIRNIHAMKTFTCFALLAFHAIEFAHAETVTEKVGISEIRIPVPNSYYRCDGKSTIFDDYYNGLTVANRIVAMFCNESDLVTVLNDGMPLLNRAYSVQFSKSLENSQITQYDFDVIAHQIEAETPAFIENSQESIKNTAQRSSTGFSKIIGSKMNSNITGVTSLGFFDKQENSICTLSLAKFKVTDKTNAALIDRVNAVALCVLNINGKLVNLTCVSKCETEDDIQWTKSAIRKWRQEWIEANPTITITNPANSVSKTSRAKKSAAYNMGESLGQILGWLIFLGLIISVVVAIRWITRIVQRKLK